MGIWERKKWNVITEKNDNSNRNEKKRQSMIQASCTAPCHSKWRNESGKQIRKKNTDKKK